jgi:NADPH-dependent 2,4-dienoyl-CoA reductase/sulfur reductase-like enzyme
VPEGDALDRQRVAVVSVGAGAIGGAICRSLDESGHRTVVIDRAGTIPSDLLVAVGAARRGSRYSTSRSGSIRLFLRDRARDRRRSTSAVP